MVTSRSRFPLFVLFLFLLSLLLEGCLTGTRYLSTPSVATGVHADIFNFSDGEINPEKVDQLYLEVAHLLAITPDRSTRRPRVLVVSPTHIHKEYLRLRPSAKTQNGIAIALYIPHEDKILIPHFDRILLAHEFAHYFTFHHLSVPRFKWEEIADKIQDTVTTVR